jgi:uncharacterized membrane protein YbhN (UPF0104 family)
MRKTVFTIAKFVVTSVLLYFALRGIDLSSTADRFANINVGWAIAATLSCVGQVCVGAIRWRTIIEACGGRVTMAESLRLLFIGSFFNQTLPSTIGGDGVRLLLLQRSGASWRTATYSVLIDRAIGMIVLSVLVVASLPWSYGILAQPEARLALVLVDGVALLGCATFLLFGLIPSAIATRWFALRHIYQCAIITNKLLLDRHAIPRVVVTSIASHLFTVSIAWCASQAVGVALTFDLAFLLILPVLLIMTIPISIAGWGVREQVLQFAFINAGFAGSEGVIVSLLFGAAYFIVGLAGGAIWLLTSDERSLKNDIHDERPVV